MYKLVIKDDEANKTVIAFYRQEITIGRAEGNTIRLTEQNVSRKHAKLIKNNNVIYLEDLNSYVGTYVNEEKIESRTQVKSGDEIKIGDYIITLIKEVEDDDETVLIKDEEENKNDKKIKPVPISEITGNKSSGKESIEDELDISQPLKAPYNRIVFLDSNLEGTSFDIAKSVMTIGKSPEADIVVSAKNISDIEAKLISNETSVKIKEVSGKNRMKINDDPYTILELREGDIVNLGGITFRYCDKNSSYVYKKGVKNNLKFIIIGAVVLLLAVGSFFIFSGGKDKKDTSSSVKKSNVTQENKNENSDNKKENADNKVVQDDLSPEILNMFSTGRELIKDKNWENAKKIYTKILEKYPDNEEAKNAMEKINKELRYKETYAQGVKLFTEKKYEKAIKKFESIPEDNYYRTLYDKRKKEYFKKIILLADTYMKQRKWQKARDYLAIANEIGYDDEQVILRLKFIDKETGVKRKNYKLKKTSKKNKKNTKKQRNTGLAKALFNEAKYLLLSNPEKAIKKLKKAIKEDPYYAESYVSLGMVYNRLKKKKEAAYYLKKYLKLNPHPKKLARIKQIIKSAEE